MRGFGHTTLVAALGAVAARDAAHRPDAIAADGDALEIKTRQGLSPMQQITAVASTGYTDLEDAMGRRHRGKPPQDKAKVKRKGGDKAKRKAAAKSRAKNRR